MLSLSLTIFLCLPCKHPMRKFVLFSIECPNGQILTPGHATIHKLIWGCLPLLSLGALVLLALPGWWNLRVPSQGTLLAMKHLQLLFIFGYDKPSKHHILSRTVGSPSAQSRTGVPRFRRTWFVNSSV